MNNKPFYLLYGIDKSLLDKEINALQKKLDISEIDITNYNIEDIDMIIEEAQTISMFSPRKFIIIDATSYLSDKKNIENINLLEDYFEHFNPNSYLVLMSHKDTIDSRKKIVKLISGKGLVKKVEITETYLQNYITDYLKSSGYQMTSSDLNYFLGRSGNDINNITNELDKLMLYKIEDKTITRDDITKLVEENIDNPIYDLVNFILKDERDKALKLYNYFLQNGMDPSSLIPLIAAQVHLLFQVKRLSTNGASNEEIAKILEFKNVYRVKYLLGDSYYYSEKSLLKYLTTLADLDYNIKLGLCDGKTALELFIARKDM